MPPPGYTIDNQQTSLPPGYTIEGSQPATTPQQPQDQGAQDRMEALSGMTGMPVPGQNKEEFESGKAAGSVSALATEGLGAAATGAAAALPAVLPHTIEGVKAIGSWAEAHPVQAYLLFQVMKELVPGMKKAMGIVKDVPID